MNSRHTSQLTTPGETLSGRKGPPAVTIGASSGWQYTAAPVAARTAARLPMWSGVGVGDDQVADVGGPLARRRDPAKDVVNTVRQPGVDEGAPVSGVEQERVDDPGRDDEQAWDHSPGCGHPHSSTRREAEATPVIHHWALS